MKIIQRWFKWEQRGERHWDKQRERENRTPTPPYNWLTEEPITSLLFPLLWFSLADAEARPDGCPPLLPPPLPSSPYHLLPLLSLVLLLLQAAGVAVTMISCPLPHSHTHTHTRSREKRRGSKQDAIMTRWLQAIKHTQSHSSPAS